MRWLGGNGTGMGRRAREDVGENPIHASTGRFYTSAQKVGNGLNWLEPISPMMRPFWDNGKRCEISPFSITKALLYQLSYVGTREKCGKNPPGRQAQAPFSR
jgi:hypothetical protein